MDSTSPAITAFLAALPDDPRIARKQMFGQPAAFVNRQMFFGTFGDRVISRVGKARAAAVTASGAGTAFTPREGQTWDDYVMVDPTTDPATLRALAAEAMSWTLKLPRHAPNPTARRRKSTD